MTSLVHALETAIGFHKSGNLDQAENLYREVIRLDPRHADAYHLLGLAAHQRKQHASAVEYIGQAISLRQNVAPYHCNMAAVHRSAGDFDRARDSLLEALRITPSHADALFSLGALYFEVGAFDDARTCFEKGLESQPGHVPALLRLGAIYQEQKQPDAAIRCYRQCLESQPRSAAAHFQMALALEQTGRLDEAVAGYRRALELNPEYTQLQSNPAQRLNSLITLSDTYSKLWPAGNGAPYGSHERPALETAIGMHDRFAERLAEYRQAVESNRRLEAVLDHVVGAVRRAPLCPVPFDHVYFENLFPVDFYDELLDALPDSEYYEELRHYDAILPNGKSARLKFRLTEQNLSRLPGPIRRFWQTYTPVLHSPRLRFALFEKLNRRVEVRCELSLIRDVAGYKILPHPDIPEKKITAQFYLPRDDSRTHLGTCLYQPDGDGFVKVKQFPFKANSGYSFTVSESSWHGVEETTLADGQRDSLMMVFFRE